MNERKEKLSKIFNKNKLKIGYFALCNNLFCSGCENKILRKPKENANPNKLDNELDFPSDSEAGGHRINKK